MPASLPLPLLKRVLGSLGDTALLLELLVQGPALNQAARAALYRDIHLEDDDRLLLLAKEADAPSSCLKSILSRYVYADSVRVLTIAACDDDNETSPLDDADLVELIERLARLEHLRWTSPRLPPRQLVRAVSNLSRLRSFTLSLGGDTELRYDGGLFDCLPVSLVNLDLADLSQQGTRALGQAVAALTNLRVVRIERTRFVDDALLEALGGCSTLESLSLISMEGTKLTDAGIASILDCPTLARLELVDVQGRLTRSCWSKAEPRSLKALVISLSEDVDHHSWVKDHLESIDTIFETAQLQELVVSRIVPVEALQAGGYNSLPIDHSLEVRPLPASLARLLVQPRTHLKKLDTDFWQTRLADAHQILLNCRGLEHLKLMLDEPFTRLTMFPSPLAALPRLRTFCFSISPALTPLFKEIYKDVGSDDVRVGNEELLERAQKDGTLPTIKEFRRFIKKASSLEMVKWTGRGGIGTYELPKTSSVLPKVNLLPIAPPSHDAESITGILASRGLEGVAPSAARAPRTPSPLPDDEEASTPPLSATNTLTPVSSSPPRPRRMPLTSPSPVMQQSTTVPVILAPIGEKKSPGWGRPKKKPSPSTGDKENAGPRRQTEGSSKGGNSSTRQSNKKPAVADSSAKEVPASPSPRKVVPGMAKSGGQKKKPSATTASASGSPIKRSTS